MSAGYDVVIVGGGHNGLTTAALLAKAGRRVLVAEGRDQLGGAAVTEPLTAEHRCDVAAHRLGWLHPKLAAELRLAPSGAPRIEEPYPSLYAPLPDGGGLTLWRDPVRSAEEIRRFSDRDASRWPDFVALISRAASFLEHLYTRPPIDPTAMGGSDLVSALRAAGRLRRTGKREMMETLRLFPMSIAELLDEWFESPILKGVLGAAGVTGICQGPMAAGTAFTFLHQHVGMRNGTVRPTRLVRGGIGGLSEALADVARRHGAHLRTDAWVERIEASDGRAVGVRLADGEEIGAEVVVSSLDPRRTFIDLIDPTQVEPSFTRGVRNLKFRGVCAKVNVALAELPRFRDLPTDDHLRGTVTISPSIEYLERAYDDAKYGRVSSDPYLEIVIPSLTDPDLGRHVMSILVQYAPYRLADGEWDAERREQLGDRVVATLERYAPGIASKIVARQLLTPADLEVTFGLTEGSINHGEMTLDQVLFMRPLPGWGRYQTPVANLYLCGAGTHPGGGVSGAPGANAAAVIAAET